MPFEGLKILKLRPERIAKKSRMIVCIDQFKLSYKKIHFLQFPASP